MSCLNLSSMVYCFPLIQERAIFFYILGPKVFPKERLMKSNAILGNTVMLSILLETQRQYFFCLKHSKLKDIWKGFVLLRIKSLFAYDIQSYG